jgi:hypothetical protein
MALPEDVLTDWYETWYWYGQGACRKEPYGSGIFSDARDAFAHFATSNGWEGAIVVHCHLNVDGTMTRTIEHNTED